MEKGYDQTKKMCETSGNDSAALAAAPRRGPAERARIVGAPLAPRGAGADTKRCERAGEKDGDFQKINFQRVSPYRFSRLRARHFANRKSLLFGIVFFIFRSTPMKSNFDLTFWFKNITTI